MSIRNAWQIFVTISCICIASNAFAQSSFVTFESDQFRPLALSPDNTRLFATNTPDNRLEIFDVSTGDAIHLSSVSVGLEPVAVAARNNSEVWVVNRLSDSVSIVDISGSVPRVTRTLLVGDEPADIVFAGPNGDRAFISTAHRGQNSPWSSNIDPNSPFYDLDDIDPYIDNPGELTSEDTDRADLWVFDANALGSSRGGNPIKVVTLFGDTPGPLARNADGSIVYVSVFKSGNRTTALTKSLICDWDWDETPPLEPGSCFPEPEMPPDEEGPWASGEAPGGMPPPFENFFDQAPRPKTSLILKYDGAKWTDELNRNWNELVRFDLPDKDVFAINAATLAETDSFSSVGTVQYGMAVNPVSGKIYVTNTDANNHVRFEGSRSQTSNTTVQGNLHKARITVIDDAANTVTPRHLNKHINYANSPVTPGTGPEQEDDIKNDSLAIPNGIVVTADGGTLYVAAKGSSAYLDEDDDGNYEFTINTGKVGVFNVSSLENNTFTPDDNNHITLSGGGPTGLALDESRNRLYVLTRFNNSISVVNTFAAKEIARHSLHNPEPASVVAGRPFLYDANLSSSNGEASCGVCHVGADKDELAWDLGDPEGLVAINPNEFIDAVLLSMRQPPEQMDPPPQPFHPDERTDDDPNFAGHEGSWTHALAWRSNRWQW